MEEKSYFGDVLVVSFCCEGEKVYGSSFERR